MDIRANFTAVFETVPEGGFVAWIEEIPGVNTQGDTLDETKSNLMEALELILLTRREMAEEEIGSKSVIREPLRFVA